MKTLLFFLTLLSFSCYQNDAANTSFAADTISYREGDIIFQSSSKGQGLAIQIATGSRYSHVGIVFKENDQWVVYEAVQPARVIPLTQWIARGDDHHFVVKRLRSAEKILTPDIIQQMKKEARSHLGKSYDLYFEWSDEKMYCSELVWKVYKEAANLEIGRLQQLKAFRLSHPVVQAKLKERYGRDIPYEEKVISPGAMYDSNLLIEVSKNE